jgi:poly-gamma-glutamate capsule biosynthesis protein CapA/YwtB (metallophosphatase superfamily)
VRLLPCLLLVGLVLDGSPARGDDHDLRVLFVGDIMLDGGPGHIVTNGGDPFEDVAPVLTDADLTIGNLECAIVKEGHAVDKPYTFRGPAAALPLLKRYFSAVSLANNHSGDWGKKGFATEIELLRETKLPFFGGGANQEEARKPLILAAAGRRVALLAYNDFPPLSFAAGPSSPGVAWLYEKDVLRDIKLARQHADLVLLYLHWGEELEPASTTEQKALARKLIEAGADAVLGNHPHVTQEVEWHKDRPIVYSLGNFVFDYFPNDPPVWRGWIVRLTFGRAPRPTLDIVSVELDKAGVPRIIPAAKPSDRSHRCCDSARPGDADHASQATPEGILPRQ